MQHIISLPISAYLLGSFVSEHIALPIKRLRLIRWDTLFILIEMLTVVVFALIRRLPRIRSVR